MGRITIFTLDEDLDCGCMEASLSEKSLPFTEISLTKHPGKRNEPSHQFFLRTSRYANKTLFTKPLCLNFNNSLLLRQANQIGVAFRGRVIGASGIFLNEKHFGRVDDTISVFEDWDTKRYEKYIYTHPYPIDRRLVVLASSSLDVSSGGNLTNENVASSGEGRYEVSEGKSETMLI